MAEEKKWGVTVKIKASVTDLCYFYKPQHTYQHFVALNKTEAERIAKNRFLQDFKPTNPVSPPSGKRHMTSDDLEVNVTRSYRKVI